MFTLKITNNIFLEITCKATQDTKQKIFQGFEDF